MAKSKGTKNPKKTIKIDLVEGLPAFPEESAEKEKEIVKNPPENFLLVRICSVTNLRSQLISQQSCIRLRIQLGDDFVSESPLISFDDDDDDEMSVDWEATVPCFTSRTEDLDFLTSNPILLSITEDSRTTQEKDESQPMESSPSLAGCDPFAYCTLDLLPLILGESRISQTLLLEVIRKPKGAKNAGKGKKEASKKGNTSKGGKSSEKSEKKTASSKGKGSTKSTAEDKETRQREEVAVKEVPSPSEGISFGKLPRIRISVTAKQPIVSSREIIDESNLVFLTIESIYNLPANFDEDTMDFRAGSLIPNKFDREQEVDFGHGCFKSVSDTERMKRWIDADRFPGRSSHTGYAISEDLFPVRNKLGVDLCHVMSADAARIEWNKVKRSWLSSSGREYLTEYLTKTKTWLLEIMITPKGVGKKQNPKKKGEEPAVASESMHLAAFFDFGALTFPGMRGIRAIGQLFTYCKEDVEAKCGARSKTIFAPPPQVLPETKGKSKSKERTKADKKKDTGKGASKNSKSSKKEVMSAKSTAANDDVETPVVVIPCEAVPWRNDNGDPVFVILELELMKPLTASITTEELFAKVDALIPIRPVVPEKVVAAKRAGKEHAKLINNLIKKMTKEYQKFVNHREKMNLPLNPGEQNTKDFYQFLKETGVIAHVKKLLAESVGLLIKDKFGYDVNFLDEHDSKAKHKFVTELYTRLFEEVNTITNKLEVRTTEDQGRHKLTQWQLKRIDIESRKLGFSSLQRQLFLRQRHEADIGTQFIHSSQCEDLDTAMDFTLGLLSSNRECREGLLFYATLLTKKGDFETAKLFFQVTVVKHPQYLIAGYIFSLFYQMMGNKTAAEIVWDRTRRYTAKSRGEHDGDLASAYPELLDWDANMYDLTSVHLKCVELILYVRVMALDFAYLALENELERNGRSEPYHYYLSVCHYRRARYREAAEILLAILIEKPRINHVRRLLGHCQFEVGMRDQAVKNYQFVFETSEHGFDNHLVHIRLGDYYLDVGDYKSAKEVYFESCKFSPTATSWLGVGMACYMQGNYRESERALTEANYLDRTVALVWGYLTLINLQLFREDKYEQCYCRAVRYNMNDDKVMGMINDLVYACGFSIPKLIHFENVDYS